MSGDSNKPDELAGTEAPFVSHLVELRDRLIKAVIAIGVVFGALCFWPGPAGLYDLLAAPMVAHLPKGATLIATNVISPILVPLKITLMAAFMVALPVVLYQLWAFVAPGLYSHEKRLMLPLVVSSTLLFVAGVAFCYFLVIPGMSKFIQAFAPTTITAAPDIEQYFGFVLTLFLVFGIAFEVPIAVIVLARMGIVTIAQLRQWRHHRRGGDTTRCHQPARAGHPDVHPLRARHHRRAVPHQDHQGPGRRHRRQDFGVRLAVAPREAPPPPSHFQGSGSAGPRKASPPGGSERQRAGGPYFTQVFS